MMVKGLAKPAIRALAIIGVTQLEQLDGLSEAKVAALHGMGPNGIKVLRQALAEKGLAFGA